MRRTASCLAGVAGQGVLIKVTAGSARSCMECGGCDAALDRTRTGRRKPKRRHGRRTGIEVLREKKGRKS